MSLTQIRIAQFLGEASDWSAVHSSKANRQHRERELIHQLIAQIILVVFMVISRLYCQHYEQLVTVTDSAIPLSFTGWPTRQITQSHMLILVVAKPGDMMSTGRPHEVEGNGNMIAISDLFI